MEVQRNSWTASSRLPWLEVRTMIGCMQILSQIAVALATAALPWQNPQPAAGPVFLSTGPDAADYGSDEGYPVGTRLTFTQPRYLVGAFTHFDQLFPAHVIE